MVELITADTTYENEQPVGFSCDFENGMCPGWEVNQGGQFPWKVHNGSTPSPYTGPDVDHTKKTSDGKYLYLEASNQGFLYRAIVDSPGFNITVYEDYCFGFHYNMYGKHIFSLTVYSTLPGYRNPIKTMVYKVTGQKSLSGKHWLYAQIPIKRPRKDPGRLIKFIFDGVRGQSFYSDVAIDDVKLEARKCDLVIPKDAPGLKDMDRIHTTTTTTTPRPSTTTEFVKEVYLPKAYQQTKTQVIGTRKTCPISQEVYMSSEQICCRGYVYSKEQGDACCGDKPMVSSKQGCCKVVSRN